MKVTVIGGGGVRSVFLARSIVRRAKDLKVTHIVFMDNDPKKLSIFGGFAREVAATLAPDIRFDLTTDPVEAVTDADYVITTIRVGGDSMRIMDERIPLTLGVLGQETTGAAGFSFAMRSIPALEYYCKMIRANAKPHVKVFNFTNPAGVVSQALRDLGYDFTYGICDAPSSMLHQFAKIYGIQQSDMVGECYGLNHFSYFSSIKASGREVMQEIMADDRVYVHSDLRFFEKDLIHHIGCIPNEYMYYFYYREKAVDNILRSGVTRGENILRINQGMTEELQGIDGVDNFERFVSIYEKWYGQRENSYMANETGTARTETWKFDLHEADDGGYAAVALKFIEIVNNGSQGEMILCVPNQGAMDGLHTNDVVEISCTITDQGAVPHRVEIEIPEAIMEMIRRVKVYERLAAQAIVKKDKKLAIDCLQLHPLVNSYSLAKSLAEQFIELNQDYCGGWN
jgi:6-phospho-beta-glucosidase